MVFFYPPSRFAKAALKKVATSCGAATAFLSTALGTRRAKIAGRLFFHSFFLREKERIAICRFCLVPALPGDILTLIVAS
jgi:hypothetical protein